MTPFPLGYIFGLLLSETSLDFINPYAFIVKFLQEIRLTGA